MVWSMQQDLGGPPSMNEPSGESVDVSADHAVGGAEG
jgi:hypothetical protein